MFATSPPKYHFLIIFYNPLVKKKIINLFYCGVPKALFWRRSKTDPHEYSMDTSHPVASAAALCIKGLRWEKKSFTRIGKENLLKAWSNSFNGFLHFWTCGGANIASVHPVKFFFFDSVRRWKKQLTWIWHNQEWLVKTNQKSEESIFIIIEPTVWSPVFPFNDTMNSMGRSQLLTKSRNIVVT